MSTINERTKTAMDYISAYLSQYSEKTIREYKRDITQFYSYIHKKGLEELRNTDLFQLNEKEYFTKSDVISYRSYLFDKAEREGRKNPEGTVMRKLFTMRGFFKFLQSENFPVNYMIFDTKGIVYTPDSYDVLDKDEAIKLAKYIQGHHRFGAELFSFIVISAATSIRVNALCNATFDDIRYQDERFYTISTVETKEKGSKVVTMPLEHWMYEMLLENKNVRLKKASLQNTNRVFPNLTPDIIHDAITNYAKVLGFTGRITTHSLRKMAASYEMKTRGNLKLGMMQTNHKSPEVFMNSYVDKTAHFSELPGIRMFYDVDDSIFDNVSKEQLLELLKELNTSAYEQLAFAVIDRKL